jgi:hypothetical protein
MSALALKIPLKVLYLSQDPQRIRRQLASTLLYRIVKSMLEQTIGRAIQAMLNCSDHTQA